MSRRQITMTVDVEARAGEGTLWDEELVEKTFVDAVDAAVDRVAQVLGDAPAWVICAEARGDGQADNEAAVPDKVLVGASGATISPRISGEG